MVTIRIKRDSIKKNPRAGSMQTTVTGRANFTFKLKGKINSSLPNGISESDVLITSKSFDSEGIEEIEGIIINQSKAMLFLGVGEVRCQHDITTFNHFPESEYLYEYENPIIKCNDCSVEIPFEEIIKDYQSDKDNDLYFDLCPMCSGYDTFDYKLESISEVVKKTKP